MRMTVAAPRALAVLLLPLVSTLTMALMTSAHAVASTSTLSWSTSTPYLHPDTPIGLQGSKAAGASLDVELRTPAGGGWRSVADACAGAVADATSWSCSIPAPNGEWHKGDHHLRLTQTATDGARVVQTGHVVVMPPAAKKPLQPLVTPPKPDPTTPPPA
ncbi:MAG: hypothetical protein Q7T15_10650, partial [Microcella sp.]|uniref:hypothetical protein n=1 Tax=Microcella sp. TaxID=1913979 RepID=UPI0027211E6C